MSECLISAQDIAYHRRGKPIIQNVTLELQPQEILTVIGPNGAGKTTLIRLLLKLLSPTQGRVVHQRGIRVGFTPQRCLIDPMIPLTVERFLTLNQRLAPGTVERALSEVGAQRCRQQALSELSGGEWQRVLLARAITREPDVLVLDEPTQGVDLVGQTELYECVDNLRNRYHCGVILVSHDLNIVMAKTDRVLCLNRHICCEGRPEAVSQNPDFIRLFGLQKASHLALYSHHHDHTHQLGGDVTEENADDV